MKVLASRLCDLSKFQDFRLRSVQCKTRCCVYIRPGNRKKEENTDRRRFKKRKEKKKWKEYLGRENEVRIIFDVFLVQHFRKRKAFIESLELEFGIWFTEMWIHNRPRRYLISLDYSLTTCAMHVYLCCERLVSLFISNPTS